MSRWRTALALPLFGIAPFLLAGEAFKGRCARAVDGDTVVVTRGGEEVEVRLAGIDAPELDQAFGPEAKRGAEALMLGQPLIVEVESADPVGRLIGRVLVGTSDASLELLEEGLAWHSSQLPSDDLLAAAEIRAHLARRGLWSDPAPVPPWVWRSQHPRDSHKALSDLASRVHIRRDADASPGLSVPTAPSGPPDSGEPRFTPTPVPTGEPECCAAKGSRSRP